MTWKRVLSLGAVFSLVGSAVVAVTVVLPGRGSELARRLQHEWSFGELELGPPVRVDAKTIEFPFFRVSDQRGDVALEATSVRWRRPGVLPTRAGLSIDDSVVEFTHALLNAHCDDRGRWNLSGLGEVRGLPGRVLGKRAVVQLSTHSGRSAELEILSPVLRRSSDLLEFEGSVVGASWAEGTLRAQRSPPDCCAGVEKKVCCANRGHGRRCAVGAVCRDPRWHVTG